MLISVHIPKTAGTSLEAALAERFGRRLLIDSGDKVLSRSPDHVLRRVRSRLGVAMPSRRRAIRRSYDAIHGHFLLRKYRFLLADPEVFVMTFLRDPVARVVSHFEHWRRENDPGHSLAERVHGGDLSLTEFARRPNIARLYAWMLSPVIAANLSFVGITERYEASLELLEAMTGIHLPPFRLNVGDEIAETQAIPSDVTEAQRPNRLVYEAAVRRFDSLWSEIMTGPS